jgi:hypothetical protein
MAKRVKRNVRQRMQEKREALRQAKTKRDEMTNDFRDYFNTEGLNEYNEVSLEVNDIEMVKDFRISLFNDEKRKGRTLRIRTDDNKVFLKYLRNNGGSI